MDESFDLPVTYKNEILHFKSKLLILGYTHRFQVNVHGHEVLFEPDEERNYRAVNYSSDREIHKIDIALLKAIIDSINTILK
jgi:hypothetical protein